MTRIVTTLALALALTTGGAHGLQAADLGGALAAGVARDQSGGGIEEIVCAYDWPCDEALAVAWCESRLQADVYNSDNWGLFQLWGGWAVVFGTTRPALLEARTNVMVAYGVWLREGWSPWACSPAGGAGETR